MSKPPPWTSVWAGGGSPYAIDSKKFGMWLFIISDALTFSALLMAYTYCGCPLPNWPKPFHFSPSIIFSSVMTFCLLSSSLTMVMAVHCHESRQPQSRPCGGFWPPWLAAWRSWCCT